MKNIFGTDGIRAKFNTSPLTKEELPKLAYAIGYWIKKKYEKHAKVIIANDTRSSCKIIKSIIIQSLLDIDIEILDLNILPTPALFYLLKLNNFTTGIVISASHNGYKDNGLKLIDYKTGKISKQEEIYISQKFLDFKVSTRFNTFAAQTLTTNGILINYYKDKINLNNNLNLDIPDLTSNNTTKYINQYKNIVLEQFKPKFLKNIKIVLDTANGATYKTAPEIFQDLGAEIITINNTPNGKNINLNSGATNTQGLKEKVIKSNADIGFAFDGDGDRVIVVNKLGEVKDGDDILALLSNLPEYKDITTIVGTIMANQGLEDYLNNKNKKLTRTRVGDKYILEKLNKHKLLLGGEQSGHIILNNIINTGDGILVALKVLEAIILNNNWEAKTFKKYPQIYNNIQIKVKRDLTKEPFCSIINNIKTKINNGRILVRYSGTESLLRIMVEEKEINNAIKITNILTKKLKDKLI